MQRFIEIWESLPQLFILIIMASLFAPSFVSLLIILLLFSWPSLTGMVRAEFMRTRNFEFVKAARVLGISNWRIIYRHILPNALVAAVTFVPFLISEAIVALTALDFLGLGLPQEYPSLGDLVRQGKDNLQAPWIGISIFFVLSTLLTLLIFIGEGVRDALDTRKEKP
jgi:microcin C transport system permease protein